MFQVQSLVALLGLTLCVLPSHKTMAQEFSESGVVYEAARNKIGLIRYCRDNQFLAPAIADQTVAAMGARLSKLPPGETFDRQRGDRAQQAGEDGFWEAGRRRYIASVANLFRTTPAELCQEWADETLRAQVQTRRSEATTIAVAAPIQPVQPLPQAEPIQADRPPARATAAVRAARSAPPPPMPEKAPFLPIKAEFASLQRTLPAGSQPASTGMAVSGHKSGTTAMTPGAMPQSPGQTVPLSVGSAADAVGPLPREQTVTAAAPSRRLWEKWPFNRLGKPERCLMPGCRWSAPQERRSGQY